MTPLPSISPDDHPCALCGEAIPAGHTHASVDAYHAHAACREIADALAPQPFSALASLPLSDLCETLQAHCAEEIVRMVGVRTRLQMVRP